MTPSQIRKAVKDAEFAEAGDLLLGDLTDAALDYANLLERSQEISWCEVHDCAVLVGMCDRLAVFRLTDMEPSSPCRLVTRRIY